MTGLGSRAASVTSPRLTGFYAARIAPKIKAPKDFGEPAGGVFPVLRPNVQRPIEGQPKYRGANFRNVRVRRLRRPAARMLLAALRTSARGAQL